LTVLDLFTTLRNHLWNGTAANLVSRARVPTMRSSLFMAPKCIDMCRISRAEATDWIEKYFIEVSRNLFGMKELFLIKEVQKASVPVSSATQMIIHDELMRHTTDDTKTVDITAGKILILPIFRNTKLQV